MRENNLFKEEDNEKTYILSLFKESIITQPLTYYAGRILKFSERRKYSKILNDSLELLSSDPLENESLFNRIEQNLTQVSHILDSRGLLKVVEDKGNLIEYVTNVFENRGQIFGLRTNINELDSVTSGLKEYELMILAARPGNGKTTLALNIASNVALDYNKTVVIFSLEMSRLELLIKMICADAMIESSKLKKAEISKIEHPKLIESIVRITSAPIYIDDSGALTLDDFKGRVRKLMTMEKLSLIIVDYLQLMNDPKSRDGGRQQEVASISRSLKAMAKEAKCPIIALSQMSRAIEQRSRDQKPQLSDLRESGAIEQDADIVAFIYREDQVKSPEEVAPENRGMADIIIAKNRSGALKNFKLAFRPELSRFDNVDFEMSLD